MAHLHEVRDDDLCFIVDANTKEITSLSEDPIIVCRSDHNSERFTFEIPRYIDGHDMSLCDKVEVHYVNAYSARPSQRNSGMYKVTDLQIAEDDDAILLCSWLLSNNATMYDGVLNFALRLACTVGSKVDYVWTTKAYSGVQVAETIDNTDIVTEQYPDVIEQWYNDLIMGGTMGANVVDEAKEQALEAIDKAEQDTINRIKEIDIVVEVENEVLERIRVAGEEAELTVLENEREKLITEIIARLPVYDGEVVVPTIQFWLEASAVRYGPFTVPEGATWLNVVNDKVYNNWLFSSGHIVMRIRANTNGSGSVVACEFVDNDGTIIDQGDIYDYTISSDPLPSTTIITDGATYRVTM